MWLLYSALSLGSCLGFILMVYNLISLFMFMREEDTDGASSAMAKAAWGIGVLGVFLAGMPCVGFLFGLIAIVLARLERGKIYREESSLAGLTPASMGSLNGAVALIMNLVLTMSYPGGYYLSLG